MERSPDRPRRTTVADDEWRGLDGCPYCNGSGIHEFDPKCGGCSGLDYGPMHIPQCGVEPCICTADVLSVLKTLHRIEIERDHHKKSVTLWQAKYTEATRHEMPRLAAALNAEARADKAEAELARERQFCAASNHPRTAASQLIREHGEYKAGVAAAVKFADELSHYCSPHGVAAGYADQLRERIDNAMKGAS